MDKAKGKVSEFLHKSGKHDTTVHESVAPAVTHETVQPEQHEHQTTAVDREVHQDHYHTSVQPVHDKQVLPEQHHLKDGGVETREYKHGDDRDITAKLQHEQSKFKDEKVVSPTTKTHESDPVLAGEHKHHHVHEVIQPVVHKQTVEPHIVHEVNKVHEKHHNAAQVHETSALPPMSVEDFKAQGGHLSGRAEKTDSFKGEPRDLSTTIPTGGSVTSTSTGTVPSTGTTVPATGTGSVPQTHTTADTAGSKPSMGDKLNPKVDADGDGKAGILS